jgi:ActR/RegA family two-component response regulator
MPVSPSIPTIVLADQSRERRVGLQRVLTRAGHVAVTTGSGAQALRLVQRHAPPLLVAHLGVRCGRESMARMIRRERDVFCGTRVLWFARVKHARHGARSPSGYVSCATGLDAVASAVEYILNRPAPVRQPRGLLVSLMQLDQALAELSDWSL